MKIQIKTNLSTEAALKLGLTERGNLLVTPTSDELLALSDDDRQLLACYVASSDDARGAWQYGTVLHVTAAGWPGVVAGLAAKREVDTQKAEAAKRDEENRAKREIERAAERERGLRELTERLVVAEADPASLIVEGRVRSVEGDLSLYEIAPSQEIRERIGAVSKRAEAILAERKAEAIERAEAEPRAWCAEHGAALSLPLQRAAREGRRVRAELTKLVLDRVRNQITAIGDSLNVDGIGEIATSYNEQLRDGVPSEAAYRVLDACTAARDDITEAAVIPDLKIEIGPIARHDIAEHGTAQWRTGIEITVSHPWLDHDAGFVMLAEPLSQDDDE